MQKQMQQRQAQEEQKAAMREQKSAYMEQILSAEALARLGNIAAVNADKADKLENILLQNAQRGAFQGKVTEAQLIDFLAQVNESNSSSAVTVERSRHKFDDEDDLDLDNMDF